MGGAGGGRCSGPGHLHLVAPATRLCTPPWPLLQGGGGAQHALPPLPGRQQDSARGGSSGGMGGGQAGLTPGELGWRNRHGVCSHETAARGPCAPQQQRAGLHWDTEGGGVLGADSLARQERRDDGGEEEVALAPLTVLVVGVGEVAVGVFRLFRALHRPHLQGTVVEGTPSNRQAAPSGEPQAVLLWRWRSECRNMCISDGQLSKRVENRRPRLEQQCWAQQLPHYRRQVSTSVCFLWCCQIICRFSTRVDSDRLPLRECLSASTVCAS